MDAAERNRLSNQYRREADKHQIGSPYRINEYIALRLKGLTDEAAIKKVKSHP